MILTFLSVFAVILLIRLLTRSSY